MSACVHPVDLVKRGVFTFVGEIRRYTVTAVIMMIVVVIIIDIIITMCKADVNG